jgi:hypothetical protein
LLLGHAVPDLCEVACGALLYGCFFYPMFALGLEQLYRLAEAAVGAKHIDRSQRPIVASAGQLS